MILTPLLEIGALQNLFIKKKKKKIHTSLQNYRNHVLYSLLHFHNQNLCLQDLSFSSLKDYYGEFVNDLDKWVNLAFIYGVEKLELILGLDKFYPLPQSVFSSHTLSILELKACQVYKPLSVFSSLRKLSLECCHLNGSVILENADCPLLEDLRITDCSGISSVKISNLLRLHRLEFSLLKHTKKLVKIDIASPSVQSLTIRVENNPWSTINIAGCDSLKSLLLESKTITDKELYSLLLKYPLLEELYIFNCGGLKRVIISSQRIKTLVVCMIDHCSTEFIDITIPSLKNFIYISKKKDCFLLGLHQCCSLETLMVFRKREQKTLHIDSKYPLLKNLCIGGRNKLERVEILNVLHLETLHIVRCDRVGYVNVDSPKLREVGYTGKRVPIVEVPSDLDLVEGKDVWFERETDRFCTRLKEMLTSTVRDQSRTDTIFGAICSRLKVVY